MRINRSTIALASVAVVVLATTTVAGAVGHGQAASSAKSAHSTIQRGGTLVFDRGSDIISLDPTQVSDNESIWADECIYEPLYKATQNGKELVPDMATSYSLSANKLSWTFNLRHGVKFSNGQVMTSADVKFSINRVAAKASNPWTFINADLTVSLARQPVGEWILLDGESLIGPGGAGLATARLADPRGYFGRAVQSLVIEKR